MKALYAGVVGPTGSYVVCRWRQKRGEASGTLEGTVAPTSYSGLRDQYLTDRVGPSGSVLCEDASVPFWPDEQCHDRAAHH